MKAVKINIVLTIAVLILTASQSFGQLKFSLSTNQEYSDNPFLSIYPIESIVSTYNFNLENDFDLFKVGYYGSYSFINEIPERNYYWHQAAVWQEFGKSQIGIYGEQRRNQPESDYFDYTNLTAYFRTNFNLANFYFSLSPNLNYTVYDNISFLDNLKGSFNFKIHYGTEFGLTFIMGSGINYKHYLNQSSTATITYLNEDNTTEDEIVTITNPSSLTQIVSYGRIAKSITPTTGLAVQFTNRSIMNDVAEEIKDVNIIFGDESEMFDDPVNYEGNALSVELTQILFDNLVVKGGYYYLNKNYPTQGIYDEAYIYDTSYLRTDVQKIISVSIKKKFGLSFINDGALSVGLYYRRLENESNSYWFNYESNSISAGLSLEF